ncbi:HutD/Ves family protein [Phytobacter sp. V91]|uniref:HutD/Ves family protein n=1 Tax=Phytobacter sp. V91 TaxID=3369425 RepID=UPI003F63BE0F
MIEHLRKDEYANMPWKNGQGFTLEVRRFPAAEQYDWRISLATIREAGPFSRFPGYLRSISVLEGDGMYLTIDGQQSALIPPFQAFDFNGESDVSCDISGGPLLDFNVIYHAATTQASVLWAQGGEWAFSQGTRLLFNAGSALEVMLNARRHQLQHYDSLLITEQASVVVRNSPAHRFAWVTLNPVGA